MATAAGALVVLYPLIVLGLGLVWFVVARGLHKASLASLLCAVALPDDRRDPGIDVGRHRGRVGARAARHRAPLRKHPPVSSAARRTISGDRPTAGVASRREHAVRRRTITQGGDPGRRARHAVPARPRRARPRRCCRSSTSRRSSTSSRRRCGPGSPTSSSSRAAASARSRTTSTATSSSSTTSSSDGKHDLLEGGAVRVRPRRHPLRPPARPARSRARGVGRAPARRRRAVRGAARRRHHGRRRAAAALACSTSTSEYGRSVRRARWRSRPRRSRRTAASSPTVDATDDVVPRPVASSRSRRPRGRAVEPRGHRPLRVHARDLRRARPHRARTSAASSSSPTRSRCCSTSRPCSAYVFAQRSLRRRPEARLPPRQRRARARPSRPRAGARASSSRARAASAGSV